MTLSLVIPTLTLVASWAIALRSWRSVRPSPPSIVLLVTVWIAFVLPLAAKQESFAQAIGAALRPTSTREDAIAFTLWAGAALCAGLSFSKAFSRETRDATRRTILRLSPFALLCLAAASSALRFVAGGTINRYSGDLTDSSGYAAYLPHISASIVLATLCLNHDRLRTVHWLTGFSVLAVDFSLFWRSGVRYTVIAYLFATATFFLFRGFRERTTSFRRSHLAFAILGAFVLLGLLGNARATVSDATNLQRALLGTEVLGTSSSAMAVADEQGRLGGQSYLDALTQPIPRAIWPAKPRPTTQLFLYRFTNASEGRAITAPTEAYINFGFFGGLLMLLSVGLLVGVATSWILAAESHLWAMTSYALLTVLLINGYFRGYAVATGYQVLFMLGPMVLVCYLQSDRLPPTRNLHSTPRTLNGSLTEAR